MKRKTRKKEKMRDLEEINGAIHEEVVKEDDINEKV